MSNNGPHVSISAETLFQIGPLEFTNSLLVSIIVSLVLLIFTISVCISIKKNKKANKIQLLAETLYESILDLVNSIVGDEKKAKLFLPIFMSFFLFILLNNWLGLFPGVGTIGISPQKDQIQKEYYEGEEKKQQIDTREKEENTAAVEAAFFEPQEENYEIIDENHKENNQLGSMENTVLKTAENIEEKIEEEHKSIPLLRAGTADLNTTIALAIISVLLTQFFGIQSLGLSYFKKFINFKNPLQFFVGILELVSEFAKIISFAFRLFGNIFAGEVLLSVMTYLLPVIVPIPFYGLEVFVGLIQALVFSVLSLVFFNMATQSHESH